MNTIVHLSDERVQMHLEGLLPDGEDAVVSAHLESCQACQALVLSFQALEEALAGLPQGEPPADFTAGVMARIDERERSAARGRRVVASVLAVVGLATAGSLALAGQGGWAPALAEASSGVARALQALRISGDVLSPVVGALRLQIVIACAAMGLPLLFGLSRLVPARVSRAA